MGSEWADLETQKIAIFGQLLQINFDLKCLGQEGIVLLSSGLGLLDINFQDLQGHHHLG